MLLYVGPTTADGQRRSGWKHLAQEFNLRLRRLAGAAARSGRRSLLCQPLPKLPEAAPAT